VKNFEKYSETARIKGFSLLKTEYYEGLYVQERGTRRCNLHLKVYVRIKNMGGFI